MFVYLYHSRIKCQLLGKCQLLLLFDYHDLFTIIFTLSLCTNVSLIIKVFRLVFRFLFLKDHNFFSFNSVMKKNNFDKQQLQSLWSDKQKIVIKLFEFISFFFFWLSSSEVNRWWDEITVDSFALFFSSILMNLNEVE